MRQNQNLEKKQNQIESFFVSGANFSDYLLKLPDEQGFADLQHGFAVVDSDVVVEAADAESVPAEEGTDEETGPLVQLVVVDFETVGDPLSWFFPNKLKQLVKEVDVN